VLLLIIIKLGEIFRPTTVAKQSGQKLLKTLCNEEHKDRQVFVCTFSMGAYVKTK
jgi:hypothetical protein